MQCEENKIIGEDILVNSNSLLIIKIKKHIEKLTGSKIEEI